jgi:hypothetical protein
MCCYQWVKTPETELDLSIARWLAGQGGVMSEQATYIIEPMAIWRASKLAYNTAGQQRLSRSAQSQHPVPPIPTPSLKGKERASNVGPSLLTHLKDPHCTIVSYGNLHAIPAAQAGIPHPEQITTPEMSAMDVDGPERISRRAQRQNNKDDDDYNDTISFGSDNE